MVKFHKKRFFQEAAWVVISITVILYVLSLAKIFERNPTHSASKSADDQQILKLKEEHQK